ncbi:hypothetical protein SAY86_009291 [Trapa natans]|uniref:Uncharacterized protein n=1 Tax=Trapa natans TaxID=22666 RepID=A0AAN7KWG4_TRANT|nr:hypothetical protein SAY86_009291 [Trapa natans]
MGRGPCCFGCEMGQVNKGPWREEEDRVLIDYIQAHGVGRWISLPKKAGLNRCSKSCRLRWLNYLRPDVKRGNISPDEDDLIVRLHRLLGNRLTSHHASSSRTAFRPISAYNILHFSIVIPFYVHHGCRWSLIAGRLPGRTDNEIKNHWHTTLGKKAQKDRSTKLNIFKVRRYPDNPKNHINTKQQGDDITGIPQNPVQSSPCLEKEASGSLTAFWLSLLKCTEGNTNAQVPVRYEHDRSGIENGLPRPCPLFDGDTTTTSKDMEDERENVAKDPAMTFDFEDDIFLSNLLNSEILVDDSPSSLPLFADRINSEVSVGSNPPSVPSSDWPTCDLDGFWTNNWVPSLDPSPPQWTAAEDGCL